MVGCCCCLFFFLLLAISQVYRWMVLYNIPLFWITDAEFSITHPVEYGCLHSMIITTGRKVIFFRPILHSLSLSLSFSLWQDLLWIIRHAAGCISTERGRQRKKFIYLDANGSLQILPLVVNINIYFYFYILLLFVSVWMEKPRNLPIDCSQNRTVLLWLSQQGLPRFRWSCRIDCLM